MFGYLSEPEKSFAIYPLASEAKVMAAFVTENLEVKACRGHRYVGEYVELLEMRNRWINPLVEAWVAAVKMIVMIAGKYPQSTYRGFPLSIQAKWQYIWRCVPVVGKHLAPVEEAIRDHFIHALLEVLLDAVTDKLRTLLSHNVRGGVNLRNPATGAERLFQASNETSEVLVISLMGNTGLYLVEHRAQVRKACANARKEKVEREAAAAKEMQEGTSRATKKRLRRIRECGIWISMMPHKLNGALLMRDQW